MSEAAYGTSPIASTRVLSTARAMLCRTRAREGSKGLLLFTEQFYYPDGWGGAQVLQDITVHLARAGYDVRVICGSEQYAPVQGDHGPGPCAQGVSILRLPPLLVGDIHARRLLRQLWFYLLAFPAALLGARPTLYVTQTNPPLIVPLMAMVARARGVRLVIIAQDLYPELVIAHGMLRAHSLPARVLERIFSWAYRDATRVVSLGSTMTTRLRAKGVCPERIAEIPNWAAGPQEVVRGDATPLRHEWNLKGKFVILYSGNLGVAHDIETPILALQEAVKRRPEIRLVIIGQGVRLQEATSLIAKRKLGDYVLFRPPMPTEMLPHSIGTADIALVTLGSGFAGLVVPSKLLGYMARGIPSVYVGPPNENAAILRESSGGIVFANGEFKRLADELVRMASDRSSLVTMGASARRYYEAQLTPAASLRRYQEVIDELVNRDEPDAPRRSAV